MKASEVYFCSQHNFPLIELKQNGVKIGTICSECNGCPDEIYEGIAYIYKWGDLGFDCDPFISWRERCHEIYEEWHELYD